MGTAFVLVVHDGDDLSGDEVLLKLGAGHAVGVQGLVEVRHHIALEVEGAADPPVLHALHGGGHPAEDAELVPGEGELPALEVGQLQAEGLHEVVVHQARGGRLKVGGHQHGKRSAFARQNILIIVVTVRVSSSHEVVVDVGCCCLAHRWLTVVEFLDFDRKLR